MYFIPVSGQRDADGRSILDKGPGVTCMIQPVRPESRGTVHIQSPDPAAHPAIRANYMATDYDRACMIEAVQTDEEILDYIRNNASTGYHWVGTCKMGQDDMAVVDDELRVHGIDGLRVIDASVMPTVVAGNTNAAAIMIAEKGAEMILGRG